MTGPEPTAGERTHTVAVNAAIARAVALVTVDVVPDPNEQVRGVAGFRTREEARAAVKDRLELIGPFLVPAGGPPDLVGPAVAAVAASLDLRGALTDDGRRDLFADRHGAMLQVIDNVRRRYRVPHHLDTGGYETVGNRSCLVDALRHARHLYLWPRRPAATRSQHE